VRESMGPAAERASKCRFWHSSPIRRSLSLGVSPCLCALWSL
jgi:hypothetical protein